MRSLLRLDLHLGPLSRSLLQPRLRSSSRSLLWSNLRLRPSLRSFLRPDLRHRPTSARPSSLAFSALAFVPSLLQLGLRRRPSPAFPDRAIVANLLPSAFSYRPSPEDLLPPTFTKGPSSASNPQGASISQPCSRLSQQKVGQGA